MKYSILGLTAAMLLAAYSSPVQGLPVETFRSTGPAANRVNVVFLGDGYQAQDLPLYRDHTNSMIQHMFAPNEQPFARYTNFFNAHRIELLSNESGADDPSEKIQRDTALDATYDCAGIARLICIDQALAQTIIKNELDPLGIRDDMLLTTVNSSQYGGSGGSVAVYAGGNASSAEIALHELGHSFSGLADEYGGFEGAYLGPEPFEVNVTTDPTGSKWAHWIGYEQPGVGLIGAYEGARYYDRGIFRPSLNSKMRSLKQPFDAVSREKIILDIYDLVDPLDQWYDNSAPLTNPDALWVAPIDPAVIDVSWYVDGTLVSSGNVFDFASADLAPGTYEITARAVDSTDWVRINRDSLEQTVAWTVEWTDPLTAVGDLNADGSVDAGDAGVLFALWGASGVTSGDLSGDAIVDAADAGILFEYWTGDPRLNLPEPVGDAKMVIFCGAAARFLRPRANGWRARS